MPGVPGVLDFHFLPGVCEYLTSASSCVSAMHSDRQGHSGSDRDAEQDRQNAVPILVCPGVEGRRVDMWASERVNTSLYFVKVWVRR